MNTSLKNSTEIFLSPELNYTAIRNACNSLADLFCEACGFDMSSLSYQQSILTTGGQAVSPHGAASCVRDMMRTKRFIQGIKKAIDEKLKQKTGHPVLVLYAGTGPFATLLTPLTTIYQPEDLQMVIMDINPVSLEFLQKTITHFGIDKYVMSMVQADALTYTIPEEYQPDILVSETMKAGLFKEPQASVVSSLLAQCTKKPILIPENITINAELVGNLYNNPECIQRVKTLLVFDADTAVQLKTNPESLAIFSNGIELCLTDKPNESFNNLSLTTNITIYADSTLGLNESSLTMPIHLLPVSDIKKYPARFLVQYQISDNPGFTIKEI